MPVPFQDTPPESYLEMMFHSIININYFLYICNIIVIMPDVKPIDEIKYDFKQSKHEVVPKLPMRAMIVGPSGSGKSTLLVSMILDIYRGALERILSGLHL